MWTLYYLQFRMTLTVPRSVRDFMGCPSIFLNIQWGLSVWGRAITIRIFNCESLAIEKNTTCTYGKRHGQGFTGALCEKKVKTSIDRKTIQ